MDTPEILKFSTDLILSLIPVFNEYNRKDSSDVCEIDNLLETLSLIVNTAYITCESIRQNTKTLGFIIKHAKEQTLVNEEKLQWCTLEISKHTERYKTKKAFKLKNITTLNPIDAEVKIAVQISI